MPRYKLVELIGKLQDLEERKRMITDFEIKNILDGCVKFSDGFKIADRKKK